MPIEIRTTQKTTRIVEDWRTGQMGFVQYFDNKFIEKIEWFGKSVKVGTNKIFNAANKPIEVDKYEFNGTCTIHFHGKPPKEYNNRIINFNTVHNRSYGIPISTDGKKFFVASYENDKVRGIKQGLHAYDIETGALLWRMNKKNVGSIFVYGDYLVFLNGYDSIYKVGINNGNVLGQEKNRAAHRIFDLVTPYVLVDAPIGRLSVIDTEKMLVVKKYGLQTTNPLKCGNFLITDANLQGETLTIIGYEHPPNKNFDPDNKFGWPFERIIDTALQLS
jgi:hypothetical protein